MASLFVTGAVTLTLEIVGTRVISPFYGSSIYTWSALITVTLVALAAGYWLGGRAADRNPSLGLFSSLLCSGALAVATVPVLRAPVLRLTSALGVQLGSLASAAVLVAPALVLLSMLGPIAIRLATTGLEGVGRRAGDVYAVSTAGSVLGAVLAGFVLIPHLPISRIFYATAALLLALGALGFLLASRPWMSLAGVGAAAGVILSGFWPYPLPKTNVLVNIESAYGQIKVVDAKNALRYLLVNGTGQSVGRLPGLESDSQYIHALEWAPLIRPEAKRALVIGLGAGFVPSAWERHYGLTVDAVDIDPEIISVARRYFGFSPRGQVFVEDGRTFLERSTESYGLILLDAFASEMPPFQLFSREAIAAMRQRLQPQGVLAVNIISLLRPPGNGAWVAVYKTLKTVFPCVRAFASDPSPEGTANVLLFASDAPLDDAHASRRARPVATGDISAMLSREIFPGTEELSRSIVLSDEYAPVESLLARTAVLLRRNLQLQLPAVMLY